MRILHKIGAGLSILAVAGSSLTSLALPVTVYAASKTCTWTGGGSDTKFSTAANWSGCNSAAPQDGDTVLFDTGNLIGSATATVSISITNDTNPALGGLKTSDDNTSTSNNTTLHVTFDKIKFASGATIEYGSKAGYQPKGNFTFDALESAGNLTIKGTPTNEVQSSWFMQDILPAYTIGGSLVVDGATVSIPCGANIQGLVVSNNGQVVFSDDTGCTIAYPITINSPVVTSYQPLQFGNPGSMIISTPTYIVSSTVTIPSNITVGVYNGTAQLTGTISGGSITKSPDSTGTLIIGSSTITNPVKTTTYSDDQSSDTISVAENETAIMNAGSVRSSVTVYKGGVLKGFGSFKYGIWVNEGGSVAPGNSPGCLTSDTLRLHGEYQFELGGTDPCTGYDQLKVLNASNAADAVTLDDTTATLTTSFYDKFVPKKGQTYIIIDQGGDKAVKGTFKNLPEGATFTQDGVVFKISYVGGDGNDVTLTVQSVPATPDTGFALISEHPVLSALVLFGLSGLIIALARRSGKLTGKA